jgi:hypothetical protein
MRPARAPGLVPNWRATNDEDHKYVFAMGL